MADVKVVNRTTGQLETLPVEEADRRVAAGGGYDYPDTAELHQLERKAQFGSTGQQATAAVESVGRTATFGAWHGFGSETETAGRRQTLQEQSPGVAFASQAVGATIPGLLTGGAASAAAGALGASTAVAGGAALVAEGAASGLADEVEQAAIDNREVSPGRAMLIGVGGELVGRAIPAAVKAGIKGLRKAPTAAAAVAGETIEDVSEAVGKKAEAKLADEAAEMPIGPERDAALAATAPAQRARADAELADSAEKASELLDKIADEAPKKLEKEIDGTSPGQIRWASDTAATLRELAASAPETQRAVLEESATALLEAKNGKAIWRAAADARKRISAMQATERSTSRARELIDRMRAREAQTGSVTIGGKGKTPEELALRQRMADAQSAGDFKAYTAAKNELQAKLKGAPATPAPGKPVVEDPKWSSAVDQFRTKQRAAREAPRGNAAPASDSGDARERFLRAIDEATAEVPDGQILRVADVRQRAGLSKADFDREAVEAGRRGDVQMHAHDSPMMMSEADRDSLLVKLDNGGYKDSAARDGDRYFNALNRRGGPKSTGALARSKARANQGGMVNMAAPGLDPLTTRTGKQAGATKGGMFRGSDGVERYVKVYDSPGRALDEASSAQAYNDFGVQSPTMSVGKRGSKSLIMSDRLGPEWKDLRSFEGEATAEMAREYVRGVPADIMLGNWDVAGNAGNIMTDGKRILRIDTGDAGPRANMVDPVSIWEDMLSPFDGLDAPKGKIEMPAFLATAGGAKSLADIQQDLAIGFRKIERKINQAGGVKSYVADRFDHLDPGQQKVLAEQFEKRMQFMRDNIDKVAIATLVDESLSNAGQRGMVELGQYSANARNIPWSDLAASPLGNVVAAGGGAYAGGQLGGNTESAAAGGIAGFGLSLLLGRRGARGVGRALSRAGERGMVELGGEAAEAGIKRTGAGARILEHDIAKGAPDFSDWDPADFAKGKGGGRAAGKGAGDYSGGETLSTYQRSIVDGLKKNAGFAETGRVTGDAGKLGSEPTFHLQPDGSVKLVHGRLRLTAARELGRDTVYGKVVKGSGKNPEVVFEGQVKVGGGPRGGVPSGVDLGAPPANTNARLADADSLLASGQADVGVWGKAGEGAADLQRAAAPGPGGRSPVDSLEDQLAAAERWKVGSDKSRSELAEQARRMRSADELKADTDRAEVAAGATGKKSAGRELGEAVAGEAVEYVAERAFGAAIPGAGLALKAGKMLWKRLDDQAKAQVGRVARTLLSPLTSNGKWGAARAATVMTALDRFKGESPDARSAFESRKQMLTDVVASPQIAGQAMASALSGLAKANPSNYVALARRMTECLQYVSQNLPTTVGISLAHPTGIPITDSELRDVADLWNTAFDPSTALEAVARRDASPVQMKTLRDLHPDIYRDLQQAIIAQAPSTFAQLDSQTKISIDIMFGSDGTGGLFTSSEAARYVAQANKKAASGKAQSAPQLKPGASAATVESSGIRAVRTGVTNKGAA